MAAATTFWANKVLDHTFRNVAYTSPSTVYLALFTTATDVSGGGTEVTGGSYARQAVAFDAAASRASQNSALETFSSMPACTVTHWALFDASSGGNMLWQGAVSNPKTYTAGEDATVAVGVLDVSIA